MKSMAKEQHYRNDPYKIWNQCDAKRAYTKAAAKRIALKFGSDYNAYHCGICHFWHVGRKRKS